MRGSGACCAGKVRRSQGLLFNPLLLQPLASLLRRLSAASRRICLAISKRREASSTLDRRTDADMTVTCIVAPWQPGSTTIETGKRHRVDVRCMAACLRCMTRIDRMTVDVAIPTVPGSQDPEYPGYF